MKKFILLTLMCLMNTHVFADDCGSYSSQSEMTNCAIKKLAQSEKILDQKIKKISEILEYKVEFERANKMWQKYSDAHCLSVTKIYEGGSIYNYALAECKVNQTNIRINSLENDYKDTINIITKGSP